MKYLIQGNLPMLFCFSKGLLHLVINLYCFILYVLSTFIDFVPQCHHIVQLVLEIFDGLRITSLSVPALLNSKENTKHFQQQICS